MKKIFTLLLLSLLTTSFLLADPVSKNDAQLIAMNFLKAQTSDGKIDFKISDFKTFEYEGEATLYIFSFNPTGFVIISADDNASPIIGYSTTNNFGSGLNCPNVIFQFEHYSKQIKQLKSEKSQNKEVKQEWDIYKSGKTKSIAAAVSPLLTTTWNQSPLYNDMCPEGSVTGCVATAMAQIMNYHEWPTTGQGWHKYTPSSNPTFGVQYADFSNTAYDWSNMPDNLTSSNTSTEKNAVATLMYHAGISVNMDYSVDASSAYSSDVMYALVNYFKYDPTTINTYDFDSYSQSAWLTLVKGELDQGRPILYSGSTTSHEGHAWVCDGYDVSDKLHMNWGWGGSADGYFTAGALTAGGYSFTENNSIITGIKPNQTTQSMLWVKQNSGFASSSRGIKSISAVSNNIAWAVAYDGSGSSEKVKDFTRTVDGGSTWTSGTINATGITNYEAAMISAVSDKKAWVALYYVSDDKTTSTGKIVNTTDGGATWTVQATASFSATTGFPNVLHFWDENNGFCMGDPKSGEFEIFTTTNGGTTWTRVAGSNIPNAQSSEYGTVGYCAVYNNTVWFATSKGRIFKSTDKGNTWSVYQTPITDASFELSFKDENTGIIQRRGEGPNDSYITTNGGQTWSQLTTTGNFYQSSFMFIPGSNLLVSTGSDYSTPFEGVSYSTDNGSTFTDYANFYKNYQFTAIGAASEKSIWVGGYNISQYNAGIWHLGDILPSAEFSVNKTSVEINDSTVVFTDQTYGTPDSRTWDFGDGASTSVTSGAGPITVKYTTTGTKTVTLTITKGTDQQIYVKENCLTVTWKTGVDQPNLDKQYSVYPNPASISIKINGYTKGRVKVFSTNGALMLEKENLTDGTLDINNLANGIYLINIETPQGVVTKKLSISK